MGIFNNLGPRQIRVRRAEFSCVKSVVPLWVRTNKCWKKHQFQQVKINVYPSNFKYATKNDKPVISQKMWKMWWRDRKRARKCLPCTSPSFRKSFVSLHTKSSSGNIDFNSDLATLPSSRWGLPRNFYAISSTVEEKLSELLLYSHFWRTKHIEDEQLNSFWFFIWAS